MKIEELNRIVLKFLRDHIPHPTGETYNWIWLAFPREKVRIPSIGILQETSVSYPAGIGHTEHLQGVVYRIEALTDSKYEAIIDSVRYSASKLTAYLVDQICSAFRTYREELRSKGVVDATIQRIETLDYDPELDFYRQSVFVEVLAYLAE